MRQTSHTYKEAIETAYNLQTELSNEPKTIILITGPLQRHCAIKVFLITIFVTSLEELRLARKGSYRSNIYF